MKAGYRHQGRTIFEAFVAAAGDIGAKEVVVEDALGNASTYRELLTGANVLARKFRRWSGEGEAIGVLLPNANAIVATFLGLVSAGRVPALLNYTAGPGVIVSACRTARVTQVIASRAFVDKADLKPTVKALETASIRIHWLEDLRQDVNALDKLVGYLRRNRPLVRRRPDDMALILFTSGSEGLPKGVVLSHANILANCAQIADRISFSTKDKLFNVLPVFHSFGLTGGMILPLVNGVRLYLYPSPLHYKIIPQAVARIKPTIMLGTDTFLTGYARTAKDADFGSVRLVVAGAEAVRADTVENWRRRFDVAVLEGFGMTEAAPVVAVNAVEANRIGTVGRLLEGVESRLEPVEGLDDAGRLWIRGPNVMMGYMRPENPGVVERLPDGWHDTGDIVSIDADGFVTIRGRAKRFAKIAGEMVSLGAVELMARHLWPEENHAVVSVPDRRKGEKVILVTTATGAKRDALIEASRQSGYSELWVPNAIIHVPEIPMLGTGKTDYGSARRIAMEKLEQDAN